MICKTFEIRDRMTCIPALAVELVGTNYAQDRVLRHGGYSINPPAYQLTMLQSSKTQADPYAWSDRTMQTAHLYIEENWSTLNDGDIIDVQFILGETTEKVQTDWER